jgi:pimeloyl-ACP methyl ester carboxylesterase
MPYIETRDGTALYLKEWGKGRPVVLLHGWPLSSDIFDDLALALAEHGFRAIAYDRRGFGRSDQPWNGYDYDTLADDLADVLEETGAENATLVGFSMGGGEVARFMSRYGGDGVRGVVLISSVTPYLLRTADNPDGVDRKVFDAMTQGIKDDRAKFWSSFFKEFYGVGRVSHEVSDEVLEWSRNLAMHAGLRPTLACAKAFATTDFRPDLAHFHVPTLIIHGTADKTVPVDASARRTARAIGAARLVEYDGSPHGLLASDKGRLTGDLLAFLRQRAMDLPAAHYQEVRNDAERSDGHAGDGADPETARAERGD